MDESERPRPTLSVVDATTEASPAEPTAELIAPLELAAAFRLYARYVAAIALRLLGRDDEVDDVVQEVFLSAAGGLGRLRDPEALKGWLATVTVRLAGRRLRARRMRAWLHLDRAPSYEAL